jgi:hypothetical protein
MLRKEGSAGHNVALNVKKCRMTGSHYQNLESYCEEGTVNDAQYNEYNKPRRKKKQSLREVREFEDIKARIQVIHQNSQQI